MSLHDHGISDNDGWKITNVGRTRGVYRICRYVTQLWLGVYTILESPGERRMFLKAHILKSSHVGPFVLIGRWACTLLLCHSGLGLLVLNWPSKVMWPFLDYCDISSTLCFISLKANLIPVELPLSLFNYKQLPIPTFSEFEVNIRDIRNLIILKEIHLS